MQVHYDDPIPPAFVPDHLVRATDDVVVPAQTPQVESRTVDGSMAAQSVQSDVTCRVPYCLSHWVPAARTIHRLVPLLDHADRHCRRTAARVPDAQSGRDFKPQGLFIVEGLPGVLLAVVLTRYLYDSPASARWLSQGQKSLIERDSGGEWSGTLLGTTRREMALSGALFDRQFYALALMSSSIMAGAAGIALWMAAQRVV